LTASSPLRQHQRRHRGRYLREGETMTQPRSSRPSCKQPHGDRMHPAVPHTPAQIAAEALAAVHAGAPSRVETASRPVWRTRRFCLTGAWPTATATSLRPPPRCSPTVPLNSRAAIRRHLTA
jgi:hypothetical protein